MVSSEMRYNEDPNDGVFCPSFELLTAAIRFDSSLKSGLSTPDSFTLFSQEKIVWLSCYRLMPVGWRENYFKHFNVLCAWNSWKYCSVHPFCYDVCFKHKDFFFPRYMSCSVPSILLMSEILLLSHCAAFGMLSEAQGIIFGSGQGSTRMCLGWGCQKHPLDAASAPSSEQFIQGQTWVAVASSWHKDIEEDNRWEK